MKASLLAWIISAIPLVASDPVYVGSFDYRGKTYSNAKATLLSAEQVQITSSRGVSIVIPWKDANASVQFHLKSQRNELLAPEATAQEEHERTPKMWIIRGSVAAVLPDGIAVYCDIPQEHGSVHTGALASIRGFVTKKILVEQDKAAAGIVFVRGLKGLANHERVYIRAIETGDTRRIGETETARVFILPQ